MKRDVASFSIPAELAALRGTSPVLDGLLRRGVLPTADEYIQMNWMGEPPEIIEDEEELLVIKTLRHLEASKS